MTTAESTLRSSSYASPETLVSEMHSEGVLCMSGQSIEDWTNAAKLADYLLEAIWYIDVED